MRSYLIPALALMGSVHLSTDAATYIHAGKLIAADNDKVQKTVTVIVDDNLIQSI